jgi:hypothetical protein
MSCSSANRAEKTTGREYHMLGDKTEIFVFGSNEAGRHFAGSALAALRDHGAVNGQAEGLQGQSYGIPTKGMQLQTLPLDKIKVYVDEFLEFARHHPELTFHLVAIGCGLAGYSPGQIAPMFRDAPSNVIKPVEF